jgi:hypothetical protein
MMDATGSSTILVNMSQTTRRHIPEDIHIHINHLNKFSLHLNTNFRVASRAQIKAPSCCGDKIVFMAASNIGEHEVAQLVEALC